MKTVREIISSVTEEVGSLRRKAFSATVTAADAQSCKWLGPTIVALVQLVERKKISSLTRLCGVVGWLKRAVDIWLGDSAQTTGRSKWEARTYLSAEERVTAFKFLALEVQDGVKFHDTTLDRLVIQREEFIGLLVCGGRVQCWNEDKVAVPVIPCQSWLATPLAKKALEENHEGVASSPYELEEKPGLCKGE